MRREDAVLVTTRERELGAIINAYNQVTERLKESHDTLRDEVRRLTEELASKNRQLARRERLAALGEMAAGLAHEIRNPLGGIQLYASMLEKDLRGVEELAGLARKIRSGVRSLEALVGDVLAFAGDRDVQLERVSLSELVAEAMELARGRAEGLGVLIQAEPSLVGIEMKADRGQLVRAILNLLLNGIEASKEGGWVRVSAEPAADDPGLVSVHVADNGPGVAPEYLDRIFNPFFTTKDQGTGLGLAIVHRICEAHNGRVRAWNREEGGAIFTMILPAAQETALAGVESGKEEPGQE